MLVTIPMLEFLCWNSYDGIPTLEFLCWNSYVGIPMLKFLCWNSYLIILLNFICHLDFISIKILYLYVLMRIVSKCVILFLMMRVLNEYKNNSFYDTIAKPTGAYRCSAFIVNIHMLHFLKCYYKYDFHVATREKTLCRSR